MGGEPAERGRLEGWKKTVRPSRLKCSIAHHLDADFEPARHTGRPSGEDMVAKFPKPEPKLSEKVAGMEE